VTSATPPSGTSTPVNGVTGSRHTTYRPAGRLSITTLQVTPPLTYRARTAACVRTVKSSTGLTSISVAFTGWCPVGNVLHWFGLRGLLADPARPHLYVMRTDGWYLERRIYVTVGVNITLASILSLVHSPYWLGFTGFVGIAMVWFSATGFCILANYLYWIGCEPRLVPQPPVTTVHEPTPVWPQMHT